MDEFGSVSNPEGGVFGMAEAYYGSIECQQAGSLHMHTLVFLSWVYQHTPLEEIAAMMQDQKADFYAELAHFTQHTAQESYADIGKLDESTLDRLEKQHAGGYAGEATMLMYGPRGSALDDMTPEEWRAYHNHDADDIKDAANLG